MTRSLHSLAALAVLAVLAAAWAVPARATGPYVSGLKAGFENQKLVVSFGVGAAFDREDLREAISSTRTVTLTFTVEAVKHRTAWKNKTLARRVVQRRVTFDNLTRQYTVETLVDGQQTGRVVVGSWEEMAAAAGRVEGLAVTGVADMEPSATYSVRAKVRLLSGFTLWIIPWDVETPWVSLELNTP